MPHDALLRVLLWCAQIHGPTPSNLLQDKLGEYRRVQLRVITERGVYEMVGMPNVMMWYAPGGTWNIGKRDELGQNRGWYQAVSKAISPEGITNWQVWDGANKKWEKASDLEAISVGSKRIAFTGSTPKGVNADKLGEYLRKANTFCELRAVYDCVDMPGRSIWYTKPYWYVGQSEDVGKAQGWLCCKDDAPCPELTKAAWRVSDGQQMVDAADVRCMPVGATTVMVAGETPNDLNSDKLGEFSRRLGQEVNGRPIYAQVGNDNRMIWYAAGYWYLGKKNELGKSQGWLCVRDPAPAPELVQSIWRVGDGERLHQAPNVRCAAIGARTIEVLGAPVNGLHKDKMGEFRMISATEVNGKPVYEKEPAVSHMVWASNGYWYVGKRDELGKQAGWMQVRDSAPLPEEITGVWQIWNQMDKRWIPSEAVRVTAVGNERVAIAGPTPTACAIHADKLGTYRRVKGQECNGHAFYRRTDIDAMLWCAEGVWWIGPSNSLGNKSGFWRCADSARVPEAIKGCWEVGDGTAWHRAEGVTCAEHVRTRVVLAGSTPGERHQDKLGTYQLCEGELVNDRVCYQQVGNPSRMIWFLTPYWYVGKRDEKALGQGWVQVRSLAPVPELIAGVWSVWNSTERKWVEAPDLHLHADDAGDGPEAESPNRPGGGANAQGVLSVPKALPIDSDAPNGEAVAAGAGLANAAAGSVAAVALSGAAAGSGASGATHQYQCFMLHEWGPSDVHGRLAHERISRVHDFLRLHGVNSWFSSERVPGNVLETTCAALDDSEIALVFVSQRTLDRIAGKQGAADPLKKAFEYAERTKGADMLIPVVIDPAVRSSRDWWGGVGMVLGSRPITDLSAEPTEPAWEAGLRGLLDEIALLRGGPPPTAAALPTAGNYGATNGGESLSKGVAVGLGGLPAAQLQPRPERRESAGSAAVGAAAASSSASLAAPVPMEPPRELTMAQKVQRIREELSLEANLPIAKAVAEANAVMGIEPAGPLAKQVETLLTELGVL